MGTIKIQILWEALRHWNVMGWKKNYNRHWSLNLYILVNVYHLINLRPHPKGVYRVRFKEWPPLVFGVVTTFLLRLLQFNIMSCLLWIHLSKEVQYISIDQLELKLHIKMCFQSDPNFYVFEQNSRGWEFVF